MEFCFRRNNNCVKTPFCSQVSGFKAGVFFRFVFYSRGCIMKRTTLNFIIDLVAFFGLLGLAFAGFIMKYILHWGWIKKLLQIAVWFFVFTKNDQMLTQGLFYVD